MISVIAEIKGGKVSAKIVPPLAGYEMSKESAEKIIENPKSAQWLNVDGIYFAKPDRPAAMPKTKKAKAAPIPMQTKKASVDEVLKAIKEIELRGARVLRVGEWIWVEGSVSPESKKALKKIGFNWNKDRAAFQHSCGVPRKRNRKIDPKKIYNTSEVKL